jgi:hypothetical protein
MSPHARSLTGDGAPSALPASATALAMDGGTAGLGSPLFACFGWQPLHCPTTQPSSVATDASARAGNRRFWLLSALRAHTKAPYKTDYKGKR